MHHAVSLRLVRTEGRAEVELADRGTRPVRAPLPAELLADTEARLARMLAPPAVLIPGLDVSRSDDEARAGQLLGALVTRDPALAHALGAWLGEARGRDHVPVLVVDMLEPCDRALPWELFALDGPPLEVAEGVAIVRRLPGPAAQPLPVGPLSVVGWCADPDDPASQRLLAGVDEALVASGLGPHHPPDVAPEGPVLLHLIGHGRQLAEGFAVASADGHASAPTTAHVLRPLLQRAALVVLDVCEAADSTRAELDTLAGQLVRSGARAVLAPVQRLAVEAAEASTRALYPTLAAGAGPVAAVAAARRAVRALASPHPDGRWTNLGLFLADVSVLDAAPLVGGGWRPDGWPAPGADLAQLLARAHEESTRRDSGFVGLEHLMLAQRGLDLGGPAARAAADAADGPGVRRLLKLRRVAEREPQVGGTPRLQRLGARLMPGASVEDLWATLWSDPDGALAALAGHARPLVAADATAETLDPEESQGPTTAATALEVLGGPEDGRRLALAPGDTLGRVGGDATASQLLYADTAVVDPFLSRRALEWVGVGVVRPKKAARHFVDPSWRSVRGDVPLRAGELLEVSPATCLRGVS